jgi:phage terminase large subunit
MWTPQTIARASLQRAGYLAYADKEIEIPLELLYAAGYGSRAAYEQEVSVLEPDQRSNYERAGICLQPKQIRFAHAARQADNLDFPNEIGVGGARGGGKSFSVFSQLAVDDCLRFSGLSVLYLRKTAKASAEQMQQLIRKILHHIPCTPLVNRIDYPNGSRLVIGGFKDDKEAATYQGIEHDVIAIEELTQLSEHTYKILRLSARSSKGWRPRIYTPFNPLGIGHQWVKKRFVDPYRKGEMGKTVFIPSTVEDNHFNNPEYVENLDDLSGVEKRAFRYGDWDIASGAYFENWNYDGHTIQPLVRIPDNWQVFACMDAGYSHWNIVHFIVEDSDANRCVFHEICHRKKHPAEIGPHIHEALSRYGLSIGRLSCFVVGTDAFRLTAGQQETLAQQYRAQGIVLTPADMSPGSRIAGWQLISRLLADPQQGKRGRLFITRNCERLIDTLPYAERDPHNPEDIKKWDTDENGAGGDDALDCARYGIMAMEQNMGMYEGAVMRSEYHTFDGAL